jgi:hypothetical protein
LRRRDFAAQIAQPPLGFDAGRILATIHGPVLSLVPRVVLGQQVLEVLDLLGMKVRHDISPPIISEA